MTHINFAKLRMGLLYSLGGFGVICLGLLAILFPKPEYKKEEFEDNKIL